MWPTHSVCPADMPAPRPQVKAQEAALMIKAVEARMDKSPTKKAVAGGVAAAAGVGAASAAVKGAAAAAAKAAAVAEAPAAKAAAVAEPEVAPAATQKQWIHAGAADGDEMLRR